MQLARKVIIEAQMPTGGFVQYLNAHDGSLIAADRPDGRPGACLVLELPTAEETGR